MVKPKEGRGRVPKLNMSSEAGRQLLHDMINFKEIGISPFIRKSYESKKFWKFREMYQKVPIGVFKAIAHCMAKIVIAQMPLKDRKMEEAKIRGEISSRTPDGKVGKATNLKKLQFFKMVTLVAPLRSCTRPLEFKAYATQWLHHIPTMTWRSSFSN